MAVEDRYVVTINDGGVHEEVAITAEQYRALKDARSRVNAALRIEESFEVVISTYIALEKYLLEKALEQMVRQPLHSYDSFNRLRLDVNVLLSAFLAAARHYRDSMPQNFGRCTQDFTKEDVAAAFSKQYDASFEFRFMEAMRNYAQHSALPVDSVRIGSHKHPEAGEARFGVEAFSTKRTLGDSFKASVRAEMPERVDLRRCARFYLQGLACAQIEVRRMFGMVVAQASLLIVEQQNAYPDISTGRRGVAAIHYHGVDHAGHVWLSYEPNEKLRALQGGNKNAYVVGRCHVSNELMPLSEIPEPDHREFG